MKKFWILLLALGLVAGFAMSASAADVKFSGSYYLGGLYTDKPSLNADQDKTTGVIGPQAFFFQRLRVETTFKVAEGLMLVTRFDALERRWGDTRWVGTEDTYNRTMAANGVQIQENIEFERAYLDFTTKIGRFQAGYLNFISWGTTFHDSNITRPGIKYFVPVGPLTVILAYEKAVGASGAVGGDSNVGIGTASDADNNVYDIGVIYKFGAGDAGIIYQKGINKTARPTANRYSDLNIFIPYAKMKFGPIYIEGEGMVGFGDLRKFDDAAAPGSQNVPAVAYFLYLHGRGDFGPAYVGARFAWISGDDRTTTDKVEGNLMTALKSGDAFNPCLILWNDQFTKWNGAIVGNTAAGVNPLTGTPAGVDTYMENVWFYQVYGGFKPVKDLDIMMSLSHAYADKKPYVGATEFISNTYGTELDLTATYKIFDNLEYMIGGAYLWTGDLFKGTSSTYNVSNNYLLMHKLTLTF
jgi:hypothetical protein